MTITTTTTSVIMMTTIAMMMTVLIAIPAKQIPTSAQTIDREIFSTGSDAKMSPTATIPLYDCDNSHRPVDGNLHQFQVWHNEHWWTHTCPENLEWRQSSCRCDYPDGDPINTICRDYRPFPQNDLGPLQQVSGKYQQFVNGHWITRDCALAVTGLVWDQTVCQCVWGPDSSRKVTGQGITPCDVMMNMTFDRGIKDEAKGSFVEEGVGESPYTEHVGQSRRGNKAAFFQGTPLSIWFFSNNELGSSLRVEFQFKMAVNPPPRDGYHIVLSNGCNLTSSGYSTPSLALGYRPSDQSYLLAFQTANNRKAIACTLDNSTPYSWHDVSLVYEDGVLFLRVDGRPCVVTQDFQGDVQTTPCPLTIGADPLDRTFTYHGHMDNVVVARYCRRYMDLENRYDPDLVTENHQRQGHNPPISQHPDSSRGRFPANSPFQGGIAGYRKKR